MAQITKVSRTSVNEASRPSYKFKTQFIIKKCPGNVPGRNTESTHRETNPTSSPGRFTVRFWGGKSALETRLLILGCVIQPVPFSFNSSLPWRYISWHVHIFEFCSLFLHLKNSSASICVKISMIYTQSTHLISSTMPRLQTTTQFQDYGAKFSSQITWRVFPPQWRNNFLTGCMISNFLNLSFSTLYSSSLWRTDTIFVSK